MIAVKYRLDTGLIVMQARIRDTAHVANYMEAGYGVIVIEAVVGADVMYVKNGWLTPLPERPDYPCFWDGDKWEMDLARIERNARRDRDYLLSTSDWTDTLSAKGRLGPKFDAWQTYRQALRDITKQPGYPLDIQWPTRPD